MITNRDFLLTNYISPSQWDEICVGIYSNPVNLYYGSTLDPFAYPEWSPSTEYSKDSVVMETGNDPSGVKFIFLAVKEGRSSIFEPSWSRSYGDLTYDGDVIWKCYGSVVIPLSSEYYSYVVLDKDKFFLRRTSIIYPEEVTIIVRKGCTISGHMLFMKRGTSTMLISGVPFEEAPIYVRRDLSLKLNLEIQIR